MIADLNGLDIMSCDLENAYLNATNREKSCLKEVLNAVKTRVRS